MTNIELTKEELCTIILAVDDVFRDCQQHRDLMIDMSEEDAEQLRDQMQVGELLLRLVDAYEHIEGM